MVIERSSNQNTSDVSCLKLTIVVVVIINSITERCWQLNRGMGDSVNYKGLSGSWETFNHDKVPKQAMGQSVH